MEDHERISPTARMVAYFRSFSDIPYAKQICAAMRGEALVREVLDEDAELAAAYFGPFLEARYKCFGDHLSHYENILELAVGTSVERGLSLSRDHRRIYVGTDLPQMISEIARLRETLDVPSRENHHLLPANALKKDELYNASAHFDQTKNLLIINEGLLYYLSRDEQRLCAANIAGLLSRHGGAWVTPDLFDKESNDLFLDSVSPAMKRAARKMSERTARLVGRNKDANFFSNGHEAAHFFTDLGFVVRQLPLVDDLGSLHSLAHFHGEEVSPTYLEFLRRQSVWELRLN